MTDRRRHRRRYLILLLLLCPVAAVALLPHPQDLSVERRAKKLVDVPDRFTSRLAGLLVYQWRTPNQIVVTRGRGAVDTIDVDTGEIRPLDKINGLLRGRPNLVGLSTGIDDWVVSPDGKWLLTYTYGGGRQEWVAVAFDGSRLLEFPTPSLVEPTAFWDRNSAGFLQMTSNNGRAYVRRFSFDGPQAPASTPIGYDPRDVLLRIPSYRLSNNFMPLGEFAQDYLLMADFGGRSSPRCLVLNLKAHDTPMRFDIQVPPGAFVNEMEVSPDGKRVGWVFDFAAGDSDLMLRHLPFVPIAPGHGNNEVWVSNLDGTAMHPVATPGVGRIQDGPDNLRWTLDSKNVTFLYRGALYTAPAG